MLASITPLGERGRHARWGLTVTAFLVGAAVAGVAVGAAIGALGSIVIPASASARLRLMVLSAAAVLAIALDTVPAAVPGPRRQVNERWLDEYRGWVYGLGYGAQLGVGVTTVVSSAATYLALIAAFLTGSVTSGALVVGCFGTVRGLTPLAARHIRGPAELLALHRMLARWRAPARWGGVALLGAILVVALLGGLA